VPKEEKYALSMRKCANCYFCSTNDFFFGVQLQIFGVQEIFFELAVQTFAASLPPFGVSFCRLMAQVLLPYGASYAALWQEFCRLLAGVLPCSDILC